MKPETHPLFQDLFERIAAGQLTRAQAADIAAEQTGRSRNTYLSWITASKERQQRLKPLRLNAGVNNVHAHKDPEKIKAYEDAIAHALEGKMKIKAIARRFQVDYKYLLIKVRKARQTAVPLSCLEANDATVATLETAALLSYLEANDATVALLQKHIR